MNQTNALRKALPKTIKLYNAGHPIRRVTPENEAHRGSKYTWEVPAERGKGLLLPRPAKRLPPTKRSPGPNSPP